jgi:hypothetical protein
MAESTSDDQFRTLQRDIREAIRRNHPNPDRIGCPGNETLRKMAEASVPPSDPGYRHVMECSPCYEELMELNAAVEARRAEATSHWRRRVLVTAIAVSLAVVGYVAYVAAGGGVPWVRQRTQQTAGANGTKQASPDKTIDGLPVAMLNLDSETSVRSNGDERHTTELQRLPRKRLDLTVNLPRGLEGGAYELALSHEDGSPLLTLRGEATIEDGLTVLRLQADLSALAPGQYQLRIRREGSSWRESQVLLF